MPRRRKDDAREFVFRGHWIGAATGSSSLYECWYDPKAQRTKRRSLDTADRAEAEKRLIENVLAADRPHDAEPQDVQIAVLLAIYLDEHGNHIASAEQQGIAAKILTAFHGADMIGDLSKSRQRAFIAHCRQHLGHSDGYISRTLSVLRAALRHAWKAEYLRSPPFIFDVGSFPAAGETAGELEAAEYAPTLDQAAAFFDAIKSDHVFMFAMIALCTGARPGAVLELTRFQRDREHRLIRLLPPGRRQTIKRRAVVPEAAALGPWLDAAEKATRHENYVHYHGAAMSSIKTAHGLAAEAAGLPSQLTPKCWRHLVAKELRRRGVDSWEVQGFLGHRPRETKTTERYAIYAPDYLGAARQAVDELVLDIQGRVKNRSLICPSGPVELYRERGLPRLVSRKE